MGYPGPPWVSIDLEGQEALETLRASVDLQGLQGHCARLCLIWPCVWHDVEMNRAAVISHSLGPEARRIILDIYISMYITWMLHMF